MKAYAKFLKVKYFRELYALPLKTLKEIVDKFKYKHNIQNMIEPDLKWGGEG